MTRRRVSPGLRTAALAVIAVPALLAAQPPARPAPPAPPPRLRAVQTMTLESIAWADGGEIPVKHAQAGRDVSPPLTWRGAPEGTVSYVLVVRDLDAVPSGGGDDFLHWLVWNIPGAATSLDEGVPQGNASPPPSQAGGPPAPANPGGAPPGGLRQISGTGPNYRGPAAPASGPAHHYVFELYALDTWIDVPAVGQSPGATRAAVMNALAGHVRGKGVLIGRYRRSLP